MIASRFKQPIEPLMQIGLEKYLRDGGHSVRALLEVEPFEGLRLLRVYWPRWPMGEWRACLTYDLGEQLWEDAPDVCDQVVEDLDVVAVMVPFGWRVRDVLMPRERKWALTMVEER